LGEREFRAMLAQVRLKNPDLIWATGYYGEAAAIASQARELGIEATILGQEGYDSPKFIELAGEAAEGVIIVTDLNRDSDREIVQKFLAEYEKRAGHPADMVAASAFDAVKVAAHAIAVAGTDAEAIAKAINDIRHMYDVVTGPFYAFLGREAIRPVEVQIVREGAFRFFHTFTEPEIIIPPEL